MERLEPYAVLWLRTGLRHRAILFGYWVRPYDIHLDARRWRWRKSGCHASRRIWAEATRDRSQSSDNQPKENK